MKNLVIISSLTILLSGCCFLPCDAVYHAKIETMDSSKVDVFETLFWEYVESEQFTCQETEYSFLLSDNYISEGYHLIMCDHPSSIRTHIMFAKSPAHRVIEIHEIYSCCGSSKMFRKTLKEIVKTIKQRLGNDSIKVTYPV